MKNLITIFKLLFFTFIISSGQLYAACAEANNENECIADTSCFWDDKGTNGANDDECLAKPIPPTADAGSDQTVTMGDNVTLDGGGSSDSDGTILTYIWTDGTTTWEGQTQDISTSGWSLGSHTITLTVTDNDDLNDTDTININITDIGSITVSIIGASLTEGNSGTSTMDFTVTLNAVAPADVTVDFNTSDGDATTSDDDYDSANGTLTIPQGATSGIIPITINGDLDPEADETFSVVLSNAVNATLGTGTATGIIIDDDTSIGNCPSDLSPEFTLDIDGSEEDITGISGGPYAFAGSTDDRYWEFNATAAAGEDINGTLRVNFYASNFNEICQVELVDENCQTVTNYSWTNTKGKEFSIYVTTDQIYYLHMNDSCGNNPQVNVAMLWYPDINGTTDGGGFAYSEPAIFKGTDYTPSGNTFDNTMDFVTTKIVNKEHDLTISIVKNDGTIFTGYKGSFLFELVDSTDYGTLTCSQLPSLKYNGILGLKSNDNGVMQTGDNSTEHGPPLIYDKAVKNVKYRMQYLVNDNDGGIINYEDLLLFNGCLGNKQSCLWGVLVSLATTGQDPNLPDYTIKDVCGLYCDPGAGALGTGNNQISEECARCVFGDQPADCSDDFAIRPKAFDVNITDTTSIFKAEEANNFSFLALDENGIADGSNDITNKTLDYNETQNVSFYIDLNVSNSAGCQVKNLTISPNVQFQDGNHIDLFKFDDVGDINMSIHETNGTEFAIIDADDTPLEDRLIEERNITFRVIPDHFTIDANLTDHNDDNNFTYLHDINKFDIDDNYEMGAELTIDIQAMGADGNITRNYMETCYAKETNLTLALDDINITYPGSVPALTQFLYYNPVEHNASIADSGEGNYSFPTPITSPITISSLPIENLASTFPADAPDGNGTTHIEYKLNFDRQQHLVVNPFQMILNDVNITEMNVTNIDGSITDTDNLVKGGTGTLSDQNATMYYARTRSSKFFYEDITDSNVTTPILIDIYCNLGFTACDALDINTVLGEINEPNWWLSLGHNETAQNDGNITLIINLTGAIIEGKTTDVPTVDTDVTVDSLAKDDTISVTSNATELPMTVLIDLDESNPTDTNHWLIYNPNNAVIAPSPFYKVRFIGEASWTGEGQTGHVVDVNASYKKSQRAEW